MNIKIKKYLFVLIISFSCSALFGQNVTASYKNISLSKVLNSISNDYKITFAFDNTLLKTIIINQTFSNKPIEEVLKALLSETNLSYSKNAEVYMIIPDKNKEPVNKTNVEDLPKKTQCHITGVVKDSKTGEQLPFATVYISGTNIATSTNNTGFFNLIANACDSMEITVNYIGYKPMKIRIPAQSLPKVVTIMVENEVTGLKEIVLEKKSEVMDNSNQSQPTGVKLNTAKLKELPSISQNDISAPLQLMPGIDGTTETSSGFLIRKSRADKNLILFDGFSIYQIDHFFGSFSSLNSKAIKDIQVYKSGYDARFGGRTGGFLEITGKSGNMYKPVFDASVDMLCADASVELPLIKDKLSLIVAGRRSFTDYVKTPLYVTLFNNVRYDIKEYYHNYPQAFKANADDPVYAFSDIHSKLTYKAKENQVFSLSYFSGLDKLHFVQNYQYPTANEDARWGTQGLSLRYTGTISSKWQQDLVVGSSITKNNFNQYDTTLKIVRVKKLSYTDTISNYQVVDNKLVDNSFSYFNTLQLLHNQSLQVGLSANNINSNFLTSNGTSSFKVNKSDTTHDYKSTSLTTCPFVQYLFDNRTMMFEIGIRANHYNLTQKNYPELRLEGSYKCTDKLLFKASAGNYHQFVNKIQLQKTLDYYSAWVISDGVTFPVVASRAIMIGCNYAINPTLNLDVEMYKRNSNNITTVFDYYKVAAGNSLTYVQKYLYGNNTASGIDIMLRKTLGNYQLWVAYTLSKSLLQNKSINNGANYAALDDQPHELKLFNVYKLKNWKFSLAMIFGSGKTWQDTYVDQDASQTKNASIVVNRLPAYFRSDAGIGYSHPFKKCTLSTGTNVMNIFNTQNIVSKTQTLGSSISENLIAGKSVFVTSDVYGLGFAPNFYINVKF
jgi:hypothetical protein